MDVDIGLINKYYDLARAGDQLARSHYDKLEKRAGDCVGCGHCDSRCLPYSGWEMPYKVPLLFACAY